MKTLFKILFVAVLALTSVSMITSCDANGDYYGKYEYYNDGWTEDGNKLIFKYDLGLEYGGYAVVYVFEFRNDLCVKATAEYVCSSAYMAQMLYEEIDEDEARLSGNSIIIDMTDEFEGLSKTELKSVIDMTNDWY